MTYPPGPPATGSVAEFVKLSAILTGIAADHLKPALDPHETAEAYFAFANNKARQPLSAFARLMSLYAQNKDKPDTEIANLILSNSDETIVYIARALMLMWFLGAWYEPTALQKYATDPSSGPPAFVVISSDAYTQGWIWRVAQTHPMGFSDLRFGYWSAMPQPLSDFIGGNRA